MEPALKKFLSLSYDELERRNLAIKARRSAGHPVDEIEAQHRKELEQEAGIKAVTVAFTDLEGRLHMLDYDKKFLLEADQLTFDGSSVRGFSPQHESDLRLTIDWESFYWLPADIFGAGKVLVFGEVQNPDGSPYVTDFRAQLKAYTREMRETEGLTVHAAPEIEGFLFQGRHAEQHFHEKPFELITSSGYFNSLPQDPLRKFLDQAAEVKRALGFENEKDHPEVAPAQFEMNFKYAEALVAADQIQLYKLVCRQIASLMDMTASFLPKPVMMVNGNGMHTNISLNQNGKNLFFDAQGQDGLSPMAHSFIERILQVGREISLVLNPSVNSYRRLDPAYEAPNQILVSAKNRGAMVRVPVATERSARIEVRSVSPDANPYLLLFTLLKVGRQSESPKKQESGSSVEYLPGNIHDAIMEFEASGTCKDILGSVAHERYIELKRAQAERCPRALGTQIKDCEILYHHEVTNQMLWSRF